MAGFFGLFNYEKPGPGVDKNGPRKKSFVIFFEILGRKFWKLVVVNLLYLLFSVPVVTNGLASVGMTYITRNFARQKHAFVWGDFIDTIRKNWKQALPVGLINNSITALLFFNIWWYLNSEGTLALIMLALTLSILVIFSFMKYYMYLMMVTFSLSIRQIYKNSMAFASKVGLKANLIISSICLLCYIAGYFLFYMVPVGTIIVILLALFIFPAFRSLLIQFTVFPVIQKYMIEPYYQEHPEADRNLLRNLNIDPSFLNPEGTESPADQKESLEDPIFRDMGRTKPEEEPAAGRTMPRQYSESEMRRLEKKKRRHDDEDDDGTI